MALSRSTCSSLNGIPEVDEPQRLMKRTNVPNELSYPTACASREILAQVAETRDPWTQAVDDHDGEKAHNGDKDIHIENEELELNRWQNQTTEYTTQASFTHP